MTSPPEPPRRETSAFAALFGIGVAALFFLWPMFYSGAPLLMGDSGGYLLGAFDHTVYALRPSFYPYWIALLGSLKTIDAVCAGQALMLAIVLFIVLQKVCRWKTGPSLAFMAIISITTTIAWWASMLISDIFFGVAALAACALVADSRQLSLRNQIILWVAAALSLLMHIAMPPAMLCLAGLIILTSFRKPRILLVGAALAALSIAALMAYPLLNVFGGHGYRASTETYKFLASRMTADGSISRADLFAYASAAPDRQADLMARYDQIMSQTLQSHPEFPTITATHNGLFLHDRSSPFEAWESDPRLPPFKKIVLDAFRRHPLRNTVAILSGSARLLALPELPTSLAGFASQTDALTSPLKDHLPGDVDRYRRSREAQGSLHLAVWNLLVQIVYWICAAAIIPLALVGYSRSFRGKCPETSIVFRFAWLLSAYVIIHAICVYTLSGDFPRYQSRMSWLVVLAAYLLAVDWVKSANRNSLSAADPSTPSPAIQTRISPSLLSS